MCIFQSGKDIPPLVRLSLRTLQVLFSFTLCYFFLSNNQLASCVVTPMATAMATAGPAMVVTLTAAL